MRDIGISIALMPFALFFLGLAILVWLFLMKKVWQFLNYLWYEFIQ